MVGKQRHHGQPVRMRQQPDRPRGGGQAVRRGIHRIIEAGTFHVGIGHILRRLRLPAVTRLHMQHRAMAKPCHQPVDQAGPAFADRHPLAERARDRSLRAAVMRLHPHPLQPEFGIDRLAGLGQQAAEPGGIAAWARQMKITRHHRPVDTLPAKLQAARGKAVLLQDRGDLAGKLARPRRIQPRAGVTLRRRSIAGQRPCRPAGRRHRQPRRQPGDGGAGTGGLGHGGRGQRTVAPRPARQMQQVGGIGGHVAVTRDKIGPQRAGIGKPHAGMQPLPRGKAANRIHQIGTMIGACQDQRRVQRQIGRQFRCAGCRAAHPFGRQMRKPGMNDDTLHSRPPSA